MLPEGDSIQKKLQQPRGRLWPYIDHANEVYTNERFFAVQNINGY